MKSVTCRWGWVCGDAGVCGLHDYDGWETFGRRGQLISLKLRIRHFSAGLQPADGWAMGTWGVAPGYGGAGLQPAEGLGGWGVASDFGWRGPFTR